ncbi:MAG: hypothetical protein GY722_00490 [bacterium]|nr:hypothetical protein [bacterium]
MSAWEYEAKTARYAGGLDLPLVRGGRLAQAGHHHLAGGCRRRFLAQNLAGLGLDRRPVPQIGYADAMSAEPWRYKVRAEDLHCDLQTTIPRTTAQMID